jgi:CheY-specific phosphatase CheX
MNSRDFAEYYLKQILSDRRGFDVNELDEELQEDMIQELENEIEENFNAG